MPHFYYQVLDSKDKLSDGELTAASAKEIAQLLKSRGFEIISIEEHKKSKVKVNLSKGVGLKERILFSTYLSIMINTGLPILTSIQVLMADTKNAAFRKM